MNGVKFAVFKLQFFYIMTLFMTHFLEGRIDGTRSGERPQRLRSDWRPQGLDWETSGTMSNGDWSCWGQQPWPWAMKQESPPIGWAVRNTTSFVPEWLSSIILVTWLQNAYARPCIYSHVRLKRDSNNNHFATVKVAVAEATLTRFAADRG